MYGILFEKWRFSVAGLKPRIRCWSRASEVCWLVYWYIRILVKKA